MLTILVASVVGFVFGTLWYTALFGKLWAKLNGFDTSGEMSMKSMAVPMVQNFIMQVILVSSVYYLFPQVLVLTFMDFLKITLVVWFGFAFTVYANAAIWERKSWKLVLLNSAYGIIMTIIVSYVVYLMQ